jgi:hypothetical protein
MASVSRRSRGVLLLAGVLLLGAGAGPGRSQVQRLEPRAGQGAQLISSLARLSPAERDQYVQAQQQLERQRSGQRLAQLDQAQRCLAQASAEPAVQRCWRDLMREGQQLRRQEKEQQSQLAQRFGLPLPLRPAGGGRRSADPAGGDHSAHSHGAGRW